MRAYDRLALSLTAALLLSLGVGAASATPDTSPAGPPRAVVASHGKQLTSALGAYCYQGECVDIDEPPKTMRAVPVHGGGLVTVDFMVPVRTPTLVTLRGERPYAPLEKRDATGRLWAFAVPRTARQPTDLLLTVAYEPGDGQFGFKVVPHPH